MAHPLMPDRPQYFSVKDIGCHCEGGYRSDMLVLKRVAQRCEARSNPPPRSNLTDDAEDLFIEYSTGGLLVLLRRTAARLRSARSATGGLLDRQIVSSACPPRNDKLLTEKYCDRTHDHRASDIFFSSSATLTGAPIERTLLGVRSRFWVIF